MVWGSVMGLCLGSGDWFGEGQSRRIGLPELTYGDGDEGIMGYSRYPCLLTTLRAVFDKIQHAFLLFRISAYRIQYHCCFG
jgi:hypothetical protein